MSKVKRVSKSRSSSLKKPPAKLIVAPSTIVFNGSAAATETLNLKLTNPLNHRVAFKVKSSAPKILIVSPKIGMIDKHQSMLMMVMRCPYNSERRTEEITIMTTLPDPGMNNVVKVWAMSLEFMNQRMSVEMKDESITQMSENESYEDTGDEASANE